MSFKCRLSQCHQYMVSRELILFLFSIIVPLFIFFYSYFKLNEPVELSVIISSGYVLTVGHIFPTFCNWGMTCIYEKSPLKLYIQTYALVGAASAAFIAEFETKRILRPYLEPDLVNTISVISAFVCSVLIGFIMLKRDNILNFPVSSLVVLLPILWLFGREIYLRWLYRCCITPVWVFTLQKLDVYRLWASTYNHIHVAPGSVTVTRIGSIPTDFSVRYLLLLADNMTIRPSAVSLTGLVTQLPSGGWFSDRLLICVRSRS